MLENVFQLVNSSKIRPDVESDSLEMRTLRIYSCQSDSTNNFNFNLSSSYYFSFENMNNSLFEKLCPYLDHCVGSSSNSTPEKNGPKYSNGDRSMNGNEGEQNDTFGVCKTFKSIYLTVNYWIEIKPIKSISKCITDHILRRKIL